MGGISCAIAGFAVSDPLLIAVGGIIGSAGYMLTRVLCRGHEPQAHAPSRLVIVNIHQKARRSTRYSERQMPDCGQSAAPAENRDERPGKGSQKRQNVIIVPGYGMALAPGPASGQKPC